MLTWLQGFSPIQTQESVIIPIHPKGGSGLGFMQASQDFPHQTEQIISRCTSGDCKAETKWLMLVYEIAQLYDWFSAQG